MDGFPVDHGSGQGACLTGPGTVQSENWRRESWRWVVGRLPRSRSIMHGMSYEDVAARSARLGMRSHTVTLQTDDTVAILWLQSLEDCTSLDNDQR